MHDTCDFPSRLLLAIIADILAMQIVLISVAADTLHLAAAMIPSRLPSLSGFSLFFFFFFFTNAGSIGIEPNVRCATAVVLEKEMQ